MRGLIKAITAITILIQVTSVFAGQSGWQQINGQVIRLYVQGNYSQAEKLAQESLKLAEESFGPNHPNTAKSLNNLGLVCKKLGR
jgi:hypothetical protein